MTKPIGPSFQSELIAAGVDPLPYIWWDSNGDIHLRDELTDEQRTAVQPVLDAHDPTTPAPVFVPRTVTRYQARAALLGAGILDAVNLFFTGLPDSSLDKLAWLEAPTVERESGALISAAHSMNLTDAQIDALFVAAGNVK